MNYKSLFIGSLVCLALPFTASADSNTYAECQQACAGNGLSCLNKCLAAENSNDTSVMDQQTTAAVNGDTLVAGQVDPIARERINEQIRAERAEGANLPHVVERPAGRPFAGRR